ncbi:MAG TPA: ADP-ribosylation factor-like protein, partial [Candidatus Obscuribacterales bacterium]
MFLIEWFYGLLESLGLANKKARLLFLGLDNAGKTTLLRMLRDNCLKQHAPTHHPTSEQLVMGGIQIQAYDLGGHKEARRLWKDYFSAVDGIVFLTDTAERDPQRLQDMRLELDGLLIDPALATTPIVVLGNKIDIPGAMSEPQLRDYLGLHQTTGRTHDPVP